MPLESVLCLVKAKGECCAGACRAPSPSFLPWELESMWRCQSNCLERCSGKVFMGSPVFRSKTQTAAGMVESTESCNYCVRLSWLCSRKGAVFV